MTVWILDVDKLLIAGNLCNPLPETKLPCSDSDDFLTYLLHWLQCSCNDIACLMYVLFHVEKVAQK